MVVIHDVTGAQMTRTITDPRPALWEQRRTTRDKLTLLRQQRRGFCGCARCDDAQLIEEVDALIVRATQVVLELSDQITDRTPTC